MKPGIKGVLTPWNRDFSVFRLPGRARMLACHAAGGCGSRLGDYL
jgi:hypothetical protein